MIYQWELSDLKAGQKLKVKGTRETWMIGYIVEPEANQYTMNSLSDGMICVHGSKEKLLESIQTSAFEPVD